MLFGRCRGGLGLQDKKSHVVSVSKCYPLWAYESAASSASVCRWEEERVATSVLLLFCLELRRFTLLLHSDIWKHTVTHLVEGRNHSGASGLLLETSKIPERCKVFCVIMWTRSSLTLVTFNSITLCPFLHFFFSCSLFCVWTFVVLFTRLQPLHWWTNSIPCWQKREHFTQKQMGVEKSSVLQYITVLEKTMMKCF